jgi:hypothetical protein
MLKAFESGLHMRDLTTKDEILESQSGRRQRAEMEMALQVQGVGIWLWDFLK